VRNALSDHESVAKYIPGGSHNPTMVHLSGVPGAELVAEGLTDLAKGVDSIAALLVSIGAPRLQQLGISVPRAITQPEHRLYLLLAETDSDGAHSRYNALVRRLVSFERALACGH